MPSITSLGRPEQRLESLYEHDPQIAAARPDASVIEHASGDGIRLNDKVQTILAAYADRPALARRSVRYVTDQQTGQTVTEFLPHFETVSYRELSETADAIARGLSTAVGSGDRLAILGFTSAEYTELDIATILLDAVVLPLTDSAPTEQLTTILDEARPTVLAASVDYLDKAVDLVLKADAVRQLVVFDHRRQVTDHHDALAQARRTLADAGSHVTVSTLTEVVNAGHEAPPLTRERREGNPLTLMMYTSGSTGAPKGAMYSEHLVANFWSGYGGSADEPAQTSPAITLNLLPMSHGMGRGRLYSTLAVGGTAYFAATSDLSTLLEDLTLVRPTHLSFVPRVWDMLYQEYGGRLDRRIAEGVDPADAEVQVTDDVRKTVLGGRFLTAQTGSAVLSPELKAWIERTVEVDVVDTYGTTEVGLLMISGVIQRPGVLDYKLIDVPELGYRVSDKPHPRGELVVRSANEFMGYYQRPEVTKEMFDEHGYYHTGDIFAETAPEHLTYLDRRNNVLKLSQGEFVTVAKLETAFETSPLVSQIYAYGNSSRSYMLAVIVPSEEATSASQGPDDLRARIAASLQEVAKTSNLQSYEIPRDFLLETQPFTPENGLLTGVRKLNRPKLKETYAPRLEQLYVDLADGQTQLLRELRTSGASQPVLTTIQQAAEALLGAAEGDVRPEAHYTDLGDLLVTARRHIRGCLAGQSDHESRQRPAGACRLRGHPTKRGRCASDLHIGARRRRQRHRPCDRSAAESLYRRGEPRGREGIAKGTTDSAHGVADRCDRLPRPVPGSGVARAPGTRRRNADLHSARQG
jgi:fatty acid CoA ligase FadD9